MGITDSTLRLARAKGVREGENETKNGWGLHRRMGDRRRDGGDGGDGGATDIFEGSLAATVAAAVAVLLATVLLCVSPVANELCAAVISAGLTTSVLRVLCWFRPPNLRSRARERMLMLALLRARAYARASASILLKYSISC